MSLFNGLNKLKGYVGGTKLKAAYVGATKVWANRVNRLYAFGEYLCFSDDNGASFTQTSCHIPGNNAEFVYENGICLMAVKSLNETVTRLYRSTDGINFTQVAHPFTPTQMWNSIALASGNGVFVIAQGNNVAYSPDGINWTISLEQIGYVVGIAFGGGKFVVIANASVNNNKVFVSTDGKTWQPTFMNITFASSTSGIKNCLFHVNNKFYIMNDGEMSALYCASENDLLNWTMIYVGAYGYKFVCTEQNYYITGVSSSFYMNALSTLGSVTAKRIWTDVKVQTSGCAVLTEGRLLVGNFATGTDVVYAAQIIADSEVSSEYTVLPKEKARGFLSQVFE